MFVSALLFPPPSAPSNDSTQPGTALRKGAASSVVPAVDTQEVERRECRETLAKFNYTSVTSFQGKMPRKSAR